MIKIRTHPYYNYRRYRFYLYYLIYFDENGKTIKEEIKQEQYNDFKSIEETSKKLYVLKLPKYKSGCSYVPFCPTKFENKSSVMIING